MGRRRSFEKKMKKSSKKSSKKVQKKYCGSTKKVRKKSLKNFVDGRRQKSSSVYSFTYSAPLKKNLLIQ
jgi:hypothetical protein